MADETPKTPPPRIELGLGDAVEAWRLRKRVPGGLYLVADDDNPEGVRGSVRLARLCTWPASAGSPRALEYLDDPGGGLHPIRRSDARTCWPVEGAREARDDDDDEQEGHPSPSRGPGVDGGG